VLTAPGSPSTSFIDGAGVGVFHSTGDIAQLVVASGQDKVVTHAEWITDELDSESSPPLSYAYTYLVKGDSSTCSGTILNLEFQNWTYNGGTLEVSFPSGVDIPNGDELCVDQSTAGDSVLTVWGYGLPAGTVAAPSRSDVRLTPLLPKRN